MPQRRLASIEILSGSMDIGGVDGQQWRVCFAPVLFQIVGQVFARFFEVILVDYHVKHILRHNTTRRTYLCKL